MRKVLLTTPTSVRCMCVTLYTQVMQTAGVSKNKFAFIIQSMAPSMASFVPISWFVRTPHRVCHLLCFVPQLGWCSNRLCLLWIGRLYSQGRSIHYSRQDPVYVIRSHTHTLLFIPHLTLTAVYRFLPLLMVACVVIVCVLNRDFGPMLTVEKESLRSTATITDVLVDKSSENEQLGTKVSDTPHEGTDDALFEGKFHEVLRGPVNI